MLFFMNTYPWMISLSFSRFSSSVFNCRKERQYFPWTSSFGDIALMHWSKSPYWLIFPLNIPEENLAEESRTWMKNCVNIQRINLALCHFCNKFWEFLSRASFWCMDMHTLKIMVSLTYLNLIIIFNYVALLTDLKF